ncbi:MAG: MFS transporter [Bacteroidales bacterium]|nr:MFS transporter [Bacteroidales bacterium]
MDNTFKGTPSKALIGTTLGFFFGSAAVSLFGPFHDLFAQEMSLSTTQVSLLIAIPTLTGSLLRIPFGAWVDSTGGKKPFFILLVLSLVGMIGMSFLLSSTYPGKMDGIYPLILILGALCGCGIATFSPGIGQTSYWFSLDKQGGALGIFGGAGTLAPGIFALLLSVTMYVLNIVEIYWMWSVFLLIGTVLYYILAKNAPYFQFIKKGESIPQSKLDAEKAGEQLFPSGGVIQSLKDSGKIYQTWFLVVIYFCSFGGFLALTAWLPTFWNKFFSIDAVMAGVLAAVFSILSASIRIPSGKLSDKVGGIRVCIISMLILFVFSLIISFSKTIWLSLLSTLFIAAALGMCNAATFKLVPKFIPKAVGGASGWIGGLGAFGGFVIPQLISVFIVKEGFIGYSHGFRIFTALSVINILLLYFGMVIPKKKEESQKK